MVSFCIMNDIFISYGNGLLPTWHQIVADLWRDYQELTQMEFNESVLTHYSLSHMGTIWNVEISNTTWGLSSWVFK